MKKMTSEIIAELQKCVDKYGDMPFALRDNEYGSGFSNPAVFVDTVENGGCMEGDTPTIGLAFCEEWETETE